MLKLKAFRTLIVSIVLGSSLFGSQNFAYSIQNIESLEPSAPSFEDVIDTPAHITHSQQKLIVQSPVSAPLEFILLDPDQALSLLPGFIAIDQDNIIHLRKFLKANPELINSSVLTQFKNVRVPLGLLSYAVLKGNDKAIRRLVSRQADINGGLALDQGASHSYRVSPLHWAILLHQHNSTDALSKSNQEKVIRRLITQGADVHLPIPSEIAFQVRPDLAKNFTYHSDYKTPLMLATAQKAQKLVQYLLNYGAEPLAQDLAGLDSLEIAAQIYGKERTRQNFRLYNLLYLNK